MCTGVVGVIVPRNYSPAILCLTSRTTSTSARIPEEDACHRARNLCVFSRVQKGTPRLTHNGCVLQRVFLNALSDVTVVLGMRQSIVRCDFFRKFNESLRLYTVILSGHFRGCNFSQSTNDQQICLFFHELRVFLIDTHTCSIFACF